MIDEFKISKGLLAHLKGIDGLPEISVDGYNKEPAVGTEYIREFVIPASTQRIGLSFNSSERQDGIYQVDVCTPRSEGKWKNLVYCGLVKGGFNSGLSIVEGGQKVLIIGYDRNPSFNERDWYVTPNSIRFVVIN